MILPLMKGRRKKINTFPEVGIIPTVKVEMGGSTSPFSQIKPTPDREEKKYDTDLPRSGYHPDREGREGGSTSCFCKEKEKNVKFDEREKEK